MTLSSVISVVDFHATDPADVQDAADARGDAAAPDGEQGGAGEALVHHDGALEHRLIDQRLRMFVVSSPLKMRTFFGVGLCLIRIRV